MSEHSLNVLSAVPLGFWIYLCVVVLIPVLLAIWLCYKFPDAAPEEGVDDELDALCEEDV